MYSASTKILVGQADISESLVTTTINNELGRRLSVVQQEMLSRPHMQALIERMNLYPEMQGRVSDEVIIGQLRRDIQIEQEVSSAQQGRQAMYTLTIGYRGWDPQHVAEVSNELASLFREENEALRIRQATRTTQFLKQELDEARERLLTEERLINEFKMQHLGELPQQETMNLSTLERMNSELRMNGEKQIQVMSRMEMLYGDSSQGRSGGADGITRLRALYQQLAELRSQYTDQYPGIIRLRNEIEALEAVVDSEQATDLSQRVESIQITGRNLQQAQAELEELKEQEAELRQSIEQLRLRIESTPAIEQELSQLTNSYESARQDYMDLQERYQDARLSESLELQQATQFQVLEAAIPPDFPAQPNRLALMIMSLILSVGFAGGAAFVAEQTDSTFHKPQELRNFTRLPILGTISKMQTTGDLLRSGFHSSLVLVGVMIAVLVLAVLAYNFGQNAQGIVSMMAGAGPT